MGKGKEKDLEEEQGPGQDSSPEDKDTGKDKSPERAPAPPTAKDLLKLDPKEIKARDLFRLRPEELTSQEAWRLDPTKELLTARQRYYELKQVFWKSRRYAPIATVGFGGYGIAMLYGEADTDGRLANRIVIKRALYRKANASIRRERRWLRVNARPPPSHHLYLARKNPNLRIFRLFIREIYLYKETFVANILICRLLAERCISFRKCPYMSSQRRGRSWITPQRLRSSISKAATCRALLTTSYLKRRRSQVDYSGVFCCVVRNSTGVFS